MKRIIKLSLVGLLSLTLFTGCNEEKESAEVKQAKEIMAKEIIKEEQKRQKQIKLRENGQGDFSDAK